MTKFVAHFGLIVAQFAIALGNYWYTFGLWPKSWASYAGFFALTIIVAALQLAINADKS